MAYTCSTCGEEHDDLPHIGSAAPAQWSDKLANDPTSLLTEDFCIIQARDYFVRGVIEIPVHDYEHEFGWGVWVSHKKENFETYRANSDSAAIGPFFGWLCTAIDYYREPTLSLKTMAYYRKRRNSTPDRSGRMRPPALSPATRGHLIERGLGNGAPLYKEALMRSFAHKFKMIANRTAVCLSLVFLTVYIAGCVGSSPRFGESQKSAATQNDGVVVISGTTLPATNHWESETGMRFHNMPTNPAFRAYDAAFVHSIQERWEQVLKGTTPKQSGMVALAWRLLPNGEVTDLRTTRSTAGSQWGAMAEKMIRDMAPFPAMAG